jgi:ABC-type multidrug transport system fused ATPase/permease subunit
MPPEPARERTDGTARGAGVGLPGTATVESEGRASAPSKALGIDHDWAVAITRKVEEVVSLVRDKTVRPVVRAVRYLIFGLVALFIGTTVAVLFAIFAIRVLTTEVPVFTTRVWASYFVVAGIFWLAALFLSRKSRSRS